MILLDKLLNKAGKNQRINLYSYLNLGSIEINTTDNREITKKMMLENAIAIMRTIQASANPFKAVKQRHERLKKAYESMGYDLKIVKAKLLYRGLVGTSEGFGRLAFEVGLSWDSILQLPFFPGSSIKGAVRTIADAVAKGEEDIGIKVDVDDIKRIFGYSEERRASMGSVTFHDAYPVKPNDKELILEPDVMTPIYKDNIEEHKASPTPIPFLTIARGVEFCFPLASKNQKDLDIAKKCLKKALEYGIGAKTFVGYSIFTLTS